MADTVTPKRTRRRASGKTPAQESAQKQSEEAEKLVDDAVLPEEREKKFRTPGFSRMRTKWNDDDWLVFDFTIHPSADPGAC